MISKSYAELHTEVDRLSALLDGIERLARADETGCVTCAQITTIINIATAPPLPSNDDSSKM